MVTHQTNVGPHRDSIINVLLGLLSLLIVPDFVDKSVSAAAELDLETSVQNKIKFYKTVDFMQKGLIKF